EIRHAYTGDPVTASVKVSIGANSTTTSSGVYQLNNVPVGQQTINATADGFAEFSKPINVVAGSTVFHIELEPESAAISGQVSAPDLGSAFAPVGVWNMLAQLFVTPAHAAALYGEPYVANATVRAYNWRTRALLATTTTGPKGYYSLDLPGGTDVLIEVTTPDGQRLSTVV